MVYAVNFVSSEYSILEIHDGGGGGRRVGGVGSVDGVWWCVWCG